MSSFWGFALRLITSKLILVVSIDIHYYISLIIKSSPLIFEDYDLQLLLVSSVGSLLPLSLFLLDLLLLAASLLG